MGPDGSPLGEGLSRALWEGWHRPWSPALTPVVPPKHHPSPSRDHAKCLWTLSNATWGGEITPKHWSGLSLRPLRHGRDGPQDSGVPQCCRGRKALPGGVPAGFPRLCCRRVLARGAFSLSSSSVFPAGLEARVERSLGCQIGGYPRAGRSAPSRGGRTSIRTAPRGRWGPFLREGESGRAGLCG